MPPTGQEETPPATGLGPGLRSDRSRLTRVHSPQLYFSVGVLLQLNISTRLSVGPSRSVIYTILLIVDCG